MEEQQPRNKGKFAVKGEEPLGRRISIRLPQSIEEKLKVIAFNEGTSIGLLTKKIVVDYLKKEANDDNNSPNLDGTKTSTEEGNL